jgi:membrane protein required for colicin V production
MSWIDWAIVIILAASAVGGMMRGFFRTACSLIGLIFGLSLAAWNYPRVAAILLPMVRIETIADVIAFFLIAILVTAIFHILGALLGRAFQWIGLGCLDRIGGGVLGFFQGAATVTIAILLAVAFFPKAKWLTTSQLPRQFFGAIHMSTRVTPEQLAERLRKGLRLLEQESPAWMHSEKPSS